MVYGNNSPFDSLALEYDTWFEEEGRLIFSIEVSALKRVLPMLPRPWLEVGVGSGRFAQALDIDNGVDPSFRLLEMARNRGINTFFARGEDGIFSKGTFGAVFLIMTLCFLQSPLAVLREAYRILTPKGMIVLGVVLKNSPWGTLYQSKKQQGHSFYKYATFYDYPEIGNLLKKSGFIVTRVISTLFQEPDTVKEIETPRENFSRNAGFLVVVAEKMKSMDHIHSY